MHALIATAYVTELRGTPATSMYVKSVIALSSCIPSAQALIAPVYVTVFRSTPDASIARKSTSARCHSPAFAHAAIAELNEIVVGSTPHARISSKISSAASTPAARDAAEIAELNETASHTAPLREWAAGGEPRAAGAAGGRRRAAAGGHLRCIWRKTARARRGAERAHAEMSRLYWRVVSRSGGSCWYAHSARLVATRHFRLRFRLSSSVVKLRSTMCWPARISPTSSEDERVGSRTNCCVSACSRFCCPIPGCGPSGTAGAFIPIAAAIRSPDCIVGAARTAPRTAPRATGEAASGASHASRMASVEGRTSGEAGLMAGAPTSFDSLRMHLGFASSTLTHSSDGFGLHKGRGRPA